MESPVDEHRASAGKIALLAVWSVLWGAVLAIGVLYNAYLFHGIDFPDGSAIAGPYAFAGWLSVYGGSVVVWFLSAWLVKKDTAWVWLIALMSIPIIVQVAWLVAYLSLGERYGYICC